MNESVTFGKVLMSGDIQMKREMWLTLSASCLLRSQDM